MEVPQKTKNRTTIWFSNSTAGYIFGKRTKILIKKIYASQWSQQHYLQDPRYGSKTNVHQQMDKEDAVYVCIYIYIYTMQYY